MTEPNDSSTCLSVHDATVELGGFTALNKITFDVGQGTLVGVVGPNGAGKSTLFNAIVGLVPLESGSIHIHDRPPEEARGTVAYVPQRERVNWRFPVTVGDVMMQGRVRKTGVLKRPGRADRDFVKHCLDRVGLWERRDDLIGRLSGGQRQRVFVARALAQEVDILLLDEAFSGVDVASQEALVAMLRELRDEGKTVLMATHDLTGLAERFDTTLCLNIHVCAYGPPKDVFTQAVLEEMYGAHGVILARDGERIFSGHHH